jgi:hypothetical protein
MLRIPLRRALLLLLLCAALGAPGASGAASAQIANGEARLRTGGVAQGVEQWDGPAVNRNSSIVAGAAPFEPPPGALVVSVAGAGIQRLSRAALADAGLDLAAGDLALLHLRRGGAEVPLEVSGDELRFYAPPPGDRWNAVDRYWLSREASPGARIGSRSVAPTGAPARATARERGGVYVPAVYDSRVGGPDGDHWFAASLRAAPAQPDTTTVTLTATLPPASGSTALTITLTALTRGAQRMDLALGGASASVSWDAPGNLARTATLPGAGAQLALTLHAAAGVATAQLDRVTWERPATLDFGGRGAAFVGEAGRWRYQLANAPDGAALYDISDPAAPLRLTGAPASEFEDGPEPRAYLLAGAGTLFEPAVAPYNAGYPSAGDGADVLYVAPEELRAALAPLVVFRQSQGRRAAVVTTEAIYARWSYGAVDPEAIRSFLRYDARGWPVRPSAVVLVGDGSSDPLDRTARGALNRNLVPPYLAAVDPWLGETACDSCYARLDADDPRGDTLPDVAIGRLPVKSGAELEALVRKLIAYELAPEGDAWRGRVALVADDADTAGDFAQQSDALAALQPATMDIERIYYDPTGARGIASAAEARARVRAAFNDGAGIVAYTGHSHQWQWALTDATASDTALLTLYDPDELRNAGRPAIVLALTCLSSAFATPAFSGTTLDERLLLAPGGAIAVWGPTGLGVAHGHEALARGFFGALWGSPPDATLGALTLAGYAALAEAGGSEALFTYALLGDPLTPARVWRGTSTVMLPLVARP